MIYNEKFRSLLLEVTEQSLVYHRSNTYFEPGTVLELPDNMKGEKHPRSHVEYERVIELIRRKYYPEKPSRLTSLYSTPYRKSFFTYPYPYKYIYLCKPLGRIHITDAEIINKIANLENYWGPEAIDLCHRYWRGILGRRYWIEILSDKLLIIREVKEKMPRLEDIIIFKKPVKAVTKYFSNDYEEILDKIFSDKTYFSDVKKNERKKYWYELTYELILKPGALFVITELALEQPPAMVAISKTTSTKLKHSKYFYVLSVFPEKYMKEFKAYKLRSLDIVDEGSLYPERDFIIKH